jgi:hypothetical protein
VPSGFLWISFCANFVFPQISQISRRFSQSTFGLIIHVTLLPQAARKNPRHPRHPRSPSKSASSASSAFPIQIRVTRVIRVPYPNPRHPRHPRSPRSKKTAFHEQNAGICISCASNTFILQNHGPSRRQTKIY